jgi:hypothetical protein
VFIFLIFFCYSRVHYFVFASELNFSVYSCLFIYVLLSYIEQRIFTSGICYFTLSFSPSELYSEKGSLNPRNAGVRNGKLK